MRVLRQKICDCQGFSVIALQLPPKRFSVAEEVIRVPPKYEMLHRRRYTEPDGNDRDRQELNLQIALGRSLIVVKGWSAPEREPVLLRAQELADQVKDDSKLTETLLALAYFACTIANPASRGSSRSALWLWPTKPRRKP